MSSHRDQPEAPREGHARSAGERPRVRLAQRSSSSRGDDQGVNMVTELDAVETVLIGQWMSDGKHMHADEVCARIERLTSQVLHKVAVSRDYGAWETLFRDPKDGRLWERTYPQGELHGGGPPRLAVISPDEARRKYGDLV
jgi:hypothetical protein